MKASSKIICFRYESEIIDDVLIFDVEVSVSFEPGRYHGKWEDCYPDNFEIEILSAKNKDGKDVMNFLSPTEEKEIKEIAEDKFRNQGKYDE